MTGEMHYKPDDRFKKFLAMSVCGERAAIQLLKKYGHDFDFDDFGAGSTEIFKDASKKRKRKPDLKCRLCGQKLEVRAKSRPQIAMSDSQTRPFDTELAATDWVGFVQVVPRIGITQFDKFNPDHYEQVGDILTFSVAELASHRSQLQKAKRKSTIEGSEAFLEWPIIVAPVSATIDLIERQQEGSQITFSNGRVLSVQKGWHPYGGIRRGSTIVAGQTIIGGVAKPIPKREMTCPITASHTTSSSQLN